MNNRLSKTVSAAFACALIFAVAAHGQANIVLVKDGKSAYMIVIPASPTVQEKLAGEELAKYLKQISGAELPIKSDVAGKKIVVEMAKDGKGPGGNNFTREESEYDAFVIKTDGQDLYLIGSNKRAVLYAVYTLLEKLGCRWPTFGEVYQTPQQKQENKGQWMNELEEFVPVSKDIVLGAMNDRQRASMKYRGFITAAWFGNTPINIVDWAAKNKLNYFLLVASEYVEADEWNSVVVKNGMIPRGFMLVVGHHSFYYFLSPDKYFKDHPEWFALVGGKRIPGGRINGQFCLSNPDAVKTLRENFTAFAKAHPEIDIFAPSPNDGYGWCECELCAKDKIQWAERPDLKKQATQDLYTRLTNQLNEDLQKIYPGQGKRIGCLAYVNFNQPPAKEKTAPGLFVAYAFFGRNWFTVPWGNAKGEVTTPEPYQFKLNADFVKQWIELTKSSGGDVTMYEYYTGRSAWEKAGFFLMHLISEEQAFLQKIGVHGAAAQVSFAERKSVPANLYVFAKSLWDTSLSTDAILADYAKARYGKSADVMIKYLNEAERNSREFNRYFVGSKTAERDKSLADCQKYLDEAKALADTDQARKNLADEQANFNNLKAWQLSK
ncbi:MAG: DUF4838 domain-containing protein [Verrucomicrobia bacterium]|nr:DUF4838 domain-containing protein [Verrucomicrobiota bacterium]MBU4289932.1 DUF4838 domain-containing protein [Verrucomicrobiota bacterium]MBU4429989.1 DUF4838 domain-containing protein [Verrucomicrobiota bacterium]MCG2678350.1 DUF4838 domain-containing protein [Kiritimatiellia bacterium]